MQNEAPRFPVSTEIVFVISGLLGFLVGKNIESSHAVSSLGTPSPSSLICTEVNFNEKRTGAARKRQEREGDTRTQGSQAGRVVLKRGRVYQKAAAASWDREGSYLFIQVVINQQFVEHVLCARHCATSKEIQSLSLRSSQSGRGEEHTDRSLENGVVRKVSTGWVPRRGWSATPRRALRRICHLSCLLEYE